MCRSELVTVILEQDCGHLPGEECEDDWAIVDAHVHEGRKVVRGYIVDLPPRTPGPFDIAPVFPRYALTEARWAQECLTNGWPTCPMRAAFGDEIPPEVLAAGRVLVRGRVVGEWSSGYECGSDYDEWFEIEDWRVLPERGNHAENRTSVALTVTDHRNRQAAWMEEARGHVPQR